MPMIGFGDMAQTQMMRRHTAQAKADLSRLSQEMVTGKSADTPRHLSGDMSPILAIDSSLARLEGYGAVTRELGLFAEAMQTALSTLSSMAMETATSLISASASSTMTHVNAAVAAAHSTLRSTISTLNTRFGDRSLFAGQDTRGQTMADADSIMLAIETEITAAGATDVASIEATIDAWLAAPGGYSGTAYLGAAALGSVPIAEGESTGLEVTADDPALRATIKGLAMATLLDRGNFSGQPDLQRALAQRAGEVLLSAETDRAYLAAGLGGVQAQVERAQIRNDAEATALGIARSGLLAIDPYEAATRLQDTETQLQLIYTITARVSRLSLAEYL